MFFVQINDKKKEKRRKKGILITLVNVVVVEMYWGIGGTTILRTVVSACYMNMASLWVMDLTRDFLHQIYPLL
jgi:hypothetical protein